MGERTSGPYGQFNFLVNIGTGETGAAQAGFQEVSGLGTEISVAEYRDGNETENTARKLSGTVKFPDVLLKRGLIRALDLHQWLDVADRFRQPPRCDCRAKTAPRSYGKWTLTTRGR